MGQHKISCGNFSGKESRKIGKALLIPCYDIYFGAQFIGTFIDGKLNTECAIKPTYFTLLELRQLWLICYHCSQCLPVIAVPVIAGTVKKKCDCGNQGLKAHPCPFLSEIDDDNKTKCNCCDACIERCSREI
jgi:hypothetical protein